MSKLVYSIHIEPSKRGGFNVIVPALPDCQTRAGSFDAALNKAKKQIEKYLRALVKAGKPIPTESQAPRPLCLPIRVEIPPGARVVLASEFVARS